MSFILTLDRTRNRDAVEAHSELFAETLSNLPGVRGVICKPVSLAGSRSYIHVDGIDRRTASETLKREHTNVFVDYTPGGKRGFFN